MSFARGQRQDYRWKEVQARHEKYGHRMAMLIPLVNGINFAKRRNWETKARRYNKKHTLRLKKLLNKSNEKQRAKDFLMLVEPKSDCKNVLWHIKRMNAVRVKI